ncbi:MAG: hypothetical protein ACRC6B_03415 [Fusobacteriaceae bacterium]
MMKLLKKIVIKILSILKSYPHVKTLLNKKTSRTKVEFKGRVRFLQETIFYGPGRVEIGECSTFGYKFGGVQR